ncbi:MAG: hypothetical protein NUV67_02770 [archaeon]|nr:hypothetical protein [archaeon]
MASKFRRESGYSGQEIHRKSWGVFRRHVKETHGSTITGIAIPDLKRLFEHALTAQPIDFERGHGTTDKVPANSHIRGIDYHRVGRVDTIHLHFDVTGKKGSAVLYRFSAANPRGQHPYPDPSTFRAPHLVIDLAKKTASYYSSSGITDGQMRELFQKHGGNLHDAYWQLIEEKEKRGGKFVGGASCEYHPEEGNLMHIQEKNQMNSTMGGVQKLCSVMIESALPLEVMEEETPAIKHRVQILRELGNFDKHFPYLE